MMNEVEAQEISRLPGKYRPLGMWGFFGYTILFSIPLVGLVCLIIFSFSNTNICRRNFARSYFCVLILTLILSAILTVTGVTADFVTSLLV